MSTIEMIDNRLLELRAEHTNAILSVQTAEAQLEAARNQTQQLRGARLELQRLRGAVEKAECDAQPPAEPPDDKAT